MPSFHHEHFKALALDFDGTLADTTKAHFDARIRAYEELAVELNKPELAEVDPEIHNKARHQGSDPITINRWVLKEAGIIQRTHARILPSLVANRKTKIYYEMAREGLDAMPGAIEFVRLAQKIWGEKIFIVTTARKNQEVVPFLGRHGLMQAFRDKGEDEGSTWRIIDHDMVEALKPSSIYDFTENA